MLGYVSGELATRELDEGSDDQNSGTGCEGHIAPPRPRIASAAKAHRCSEIERHQEQRRQCRDQVRDTDHRLGRAMAAVERYHRINPSQRFGPAGGRSAEAPHRREA
jgi:hypothetical protein